MTLCKSPRAVRPIGFCNYPGRWISGIIIGMAMDVAAQVTEEPRSLADFRFGEYEPGVSRILDSLKADKAVLIRGVPSERADAVLGAVTEGLGLLDRLRLQAEFAELKGHRQRVGEYRMTVNTRSPYQFITPHSEGDSYINIQLAAFYCLENSTDGGETLLLNTDDASTAWPSLRELVTRVAPGSEKLPVATMRRATLMYRLESPPDLRKDDEVVAEIPSAIRGLRLVQALAKPRRTYSQILQREVFAYWDSIASIDFDCLDSYARTLRACGLLRGPPQTLADMDTTHARRLRSSGVDHNLLFKRMIRYKLVAGDLILLNNLTWAHSAANWTPESGVRNVAAAFA